MPLNGFACRDEQESLVFGQRSDGSLAHVSEVPSGLECDCICPGCGERLVARKGHTQDHHFGHHGAAASKPCGTGPETALHRFAKEVLERRLGLSLPKLELSDGTDTWVGYPGGHYAFDGAVLEHRLGGIVPDVIVHKGRRDLLVEFVVTHACDDEKVARIERLDVSAIEIDLSKLPRNVDRAGLEDAILDEAPRRWLHNPRLREGIAELERTRGRREQSLRRAYARACSTVASMRTVCLARDRMESDGLGGAIGIDVPGIGCFTVPPTDWQAVILAHAVDAAASGGSRILSLSGALRILKDRKWLHRRYGRLGEAEIAVIRGDGTAFELPAGAIAEWAFALARLGILLPAGSDDRWMLWPEIVETVRGARHRRGGRPT